MENRTDSVSGFDEDRYIQSQSELRTLKSRLPDDAVQTLAREVILRLVSREQGLTKQTVLKEEIEQFCHALLAEDDRAGARYMAGLRTDGASIEAAYLTYLAGAARMLGQWWETDQIPFSATALGTTRMYAIMRALRHEFPTLIDPTKRSAVFVSVPGETHILGVRMAADLFRKDGWDIDLMVDKTHEELVTAIGETNTVLIGISASGNDAVEPLSKLMIALRLSNPTARIIISGNIVEEEKDAVALMGADAFITNVKDAKQVMASIWDDPTQF